MSEPLYLQRLEGEEQKLEQLKAGSDYSALIAFMDKHKNAFDQSIILELTMKKVGLYVPLLYNDKAADRALKKNKQLSAKIKRVCFEIAIAQMRAYERHKGRTKRIAEVIKNNCTEETGLFFVPNRFGDPTENIYDADGCHIDYCKRYDYVDIIGLLPFEQKEVEKLVEG